MVVLSFLSKWCGRSRHRHQFFLAVNLQGHWGLGIGKTDFQRYILCLVPSQRLGMPFRWLCLASICSLELIIHDCYTDKLQIIPSQITQRHNGSNQQADQTQLSTSGFYPSAAFDLLDRANQKS
jgi:hypothetical protein